MLGEASPEAYIVNDNTALGLKNYRSFYVAGSGTDFVQYSFRPGKAPSKPASRTKSCLTSSNPAGIIVKKPRQQVHQGRLAAARGARTATVCPG